MVNRKFFSLILIALLIIVTHYSYADYSVTISITTTQITYETQITRHCFYSGDIEYCQDEQIQVPRETTVTRTETYTVPNGISKEEIAQLVEGLNDKNTKAEIVATSPTYISDNKDAALRKDDFLKGFDQTLKNDKAEANRIIENLTNTLNSPPEKDPVRLATGDFYINNQDLSYNYYNNPVEIQRTYQTQLSVNQSFGKGWNFNYDTRILHNLNPETEEKVTLITDALEEITSLYNNSLGNYNSSLTEITQLLNEAYDTRNKINQTITSIQNLIQQTSVSELLSALQPDSDNALAQLSTVNNLISNWEGIRQSVLNSFQTLEDIRLIKEACEAKLVLAQNELKMHNANQGRNAYAINGAENLELLDSGIDTLTLIDEGGTPHLYFIDEEPHYDSTYLYEDNSINYFPSGSSTTPALPCDDKLYLLPDGRCKRIKKDNKEYYYSFYGQLNSIVDANNNRLTFHYDNNHQLASLRDDFGRITTIEKADNKITKIQDPKGRGFNYLYDAIGRLSEVIDAEGASTKYQYDGFYLTKVINPDNSYREYGYTELKGKKAISYTKDEEGYADHFSYFPDLGYMEYTNPSGILERHFFNVKNLNTKIEYADGSLLSMEYDEDNNLIKRVDESGYVYEYRYDSDHNLIEAIDPEGKRENWSYNEFNKISSYTDKLHNTLYYFYDEKGNLTSLSKPDGSSFSFTYNSKGKLIAHTDELGNNSDFTYDAYGYLSSVKEGEGNINKFENDIIGNRIKHIDPLGNETYLHYDKNNNLVKAIDPAGNTEEYTYNNRKDLVKYKDKRGSTTQYAYDKRHLLKTVTNPLGEVTEYSYRPDGEIVAVTIAGINHTTYEYDARGNHVKEIQVETGTVNEYQYDSLKRLISSTDPKGNKTEYGYTALGKVAWIQDSEGAITSFDYNANSMLISLTDKAGNKTYYEYDELNKLIKETDALDNEHEYVFDKTGNLIREKDKNGNITSYEYDKNGRCIKKIDPLLNATIYTYDVRDLLLSQRDKLGNVTDYAYDNLGRLTKTTDPLRNTIELSYDQTNNVTKRKDKRGNITTFEYDRLNRLVKERDPYGYAKQYIYNYLGKIVQSIDALGNTKSFAYDELARLTKETDELGYAKTYSYDKAGNLVLALDELKRVTTFSYNSRNQLTKEINALEETREYLYDSVGNLVTEIDAAGISYKYEYDKLNRLVKETNRKGSIQSYLYDANGNLVKKIDFSGHVMDYQYTALNQLLKVVNEEGEIDKEFSYDANSNLTKAVNKDSLAEYAYNALNQLVESFDMTTNTRLEYKYDENGNRVQLNWPSELKSIYYRYGKRNELLSLKDKEGDVTTFAYNPLLQEIRRVASNGVKTEKAYDAAGRLTLLKNVNEKYGTGNSKKLASFAYLYNEAGERTYQIDEEGQITSYTYDAAGRVKDVLYPFLSEKKVKDFAERFDLGLYPEYQVNSTKAKKSEIDTNLTLALPALPIPGVNEQGFNESLKSIVKSKEDLFFTVMKVDSKLEGKWQITRGAEATEFASPLQIEAEIRPILESAFRAVQPAQRLDLSQWMWRESYTYDKNSNRLSKANGWGKINYSYDEAYELLYAGNREYTHDLNGNLLKEVLGTVEASYSYNLDNRLIDLYCESPDFITHGKDSLKGGVAYTYDSFGRRTERRGYVKVTKQNKLEKEWDYTTNREYLYEALSFNVLTELEDINYRRHQEGDGKDLKATAEYIYANGSLITLLNYNRNYNKLTEKFFNHTDILDSTVMLTDKQAHVIERYNFDAFGGVYQGDLAIANWIGYNGKRFDPSAGLYNYGYRDYKQLLGRWTSVDPLADGLNWYVFCNNNPINLFDPLGLFTEKKNNTWDWGKTAGGAGKAYLDTTLNIFTGNIYHSVTGTMAMLNFAANPEKVVNDFIKYVANNKEAVGFIAYKGLEGIAAAGFTGPAGTIGSMNITIATSGNALAISGTSAVIINGQLVLGATYIVSSVSMMSGNTNGGGNNKSTPQATPNDAINAGKHTVYGLQDPATGKIQYIGRTTNPTARAYQHAMSEDKGGLRLIELKNGLTYEQARGVEQLFFEKYGGFDKLLNKINPVSATNPNLPIYLQAVEGMK